MYKVEYWQPEFGTKNKGRGHWELLDIYLFRYFAQRKILNRMKNYGPTKLRLVKIKKDRDRILYTINKTLPR